MSKTKEKNAPQGNILGFLLLDTLTTKFWMENLTQRWTWSGHFLYLLPYIFLKIVELTVLTMPGLWICLIILHVRQAFEMFRVLKVPGFYVQGLHRALNMSVQGSICHNNAWICLNGPQYAWRTWLNIAECPWICLNKLFWLWQGSQCASSS